MFVPGCTAGHCARARTQSLTRGSPNRQPAHATHAARRTRVTRSRYDHGMSVRRIGVMTGGGDAPGLNAVIRAVVKSASNCNCEVIGLEDSFDGLIEPDRWRLL